MENYSLLMGAAAVMKMAVEMARSMEKPSGHSLSAGAGAETLSPGSWLAMAAALDGFAYCGFLERDEPHSYRYSPEPRWRTTPSSWEQAVMKMAVEMAVSMEKPSGHFPVRRVPEQRLCPPDLGRDGGGSGWFRVPWLPP
ncbi:hypothetical protein QYE76_034583 [Lolium multiflorum]|uniref:Uncharacterized protein n=1 Tax=Lolium multiflorum TaxID=4521 RepID=A0AAD8VN77_LOLMU|nr:hypothetical protein QYE76_034583 [Lolium multiflorum]